MLSTTTAWQNSARITKELTPLVRLYYGDETKYLGLSARSILHDSVKYEGLLGPLKETVHGVDMLTHKIKTGALTLNILNGEAGSKSRFSDFVEDTSLGSGSDTGFYNRKCEINLRAPDVTTWANSLEFFVGIVRDIKHNERFTTIELQDKTHLFLRESIGSLFTTSDAPDSSQGFLLRVREC